MPNESVDESLPEDAVVKAEAALERFPRPAQPLWGLRDLALFVVSVPAALLLSDLLVLAGYSMLRAILGWHIPPKALQDNPFLLLTFQSVFYALLFAYIYFLIVAYHRRPFWTTVKWNRPTTHQTVRYCLGGFFLAVIVRFVPTVLPERGNFPLERLFSSPRAAYAVAAFAILIAPFMEELVFRAVLFSVFERQVGLKFAVVSTAALFAALHVPEYWGAWNHVLLIFLVGLAFSLARGLTGSLTPSVLLHLAYNASLMAEFFLETQHFRAIRGMISP